MIRLLFTSTLALVAACQAAAPAQPAAKAEPTPQEKLDEMDTRNEVPLLPMMAHHQKQNMRGHLEDVQAVVAAVVADDFEAVEKAAGRLGFSEQMGAMCTHMGAGAPGFTEQALGFHHTADRIGDAARAKDRTGVLRELDATLRTCTACHAAWKQQVVDEPTFTRLSGEAAPTMRH